MDIEALLKKGPYSLKKDEKRELYSELLTGLTQEHRQNCPAYARLLEALSVPENELLPEEDIPMIPVGLFKETELKSIPDDEVFKVLTSSGTSGQKVSRIFLDSETAGNQQRALAAIGADFWGGERLPMLVIDSPDVLKDRDMFSARGAGILGFSVFASRLYYALDRDMNLNLKVLEEFTEKYKGQKVLVFGFTYMIWEYFYRALIKEGRRLSLDRAVLIHGGGWKKLEAQSVTPEEFRDGLKEAAGIPEVHDYYGMAEQTGCIYMECPCGHLHASIYSDIITRRAEDFKPCEFGEEGIIQVLTPLAASYPGHSILTEDLGVILGEDDCPCGRRGKYFRITGRIREAEVRGCSDTYEG